MNYWIIGLMGITLFAAAGSHAADVEFVFHNFFYDQDSKLKKFVKLPLTAELTTSFKKLISGKFTELSEETYWRSYGRFFMTHAPQGYVAWENKTYWIVMLPDVDANHKYIKDTTGLHVIEFTNGKMRHIWHSVANDENMPALANRPWDWKLDGDGREKQKIMSDAEIKILQDNITWTDGVHQRMQKKFPPNTQWKD
jgi:hypothetical protein